MKKIFFLIICIYNVLSSSNAFFGEPSEMDLYLNVDSGIEKLEDKMMTFELNGSIKETGIIKEINEIAVIEGRKPCLDESKQITADEFKQIVDKGSIGKISTFIDSSCKENSKYSLELLDYYSTLFGEHYRKSQATALKKSDQIYTMSNIGLFSDGILENSGFDLIVDIEDIDRIIFSGETDYEGEEDVELEDDIDSFIDDINDKIVDFVNNSNSSNLLQPEKEKIVKYKPETQYIDSSKLIPTNNNYICIEEINNTGLNETELIHLLNTITEEIEKPTQVRENISNSNPPSGGNGSSSSPQTEGGYSEIIDIEEWPCTGFFCINTDFIMYEFNLFGGSENMTIQFLLNRSNEHLRKFAATSLIPAKMSTNLFEISLKDLNLPDIFHMSFQVTTKPIPILRLEEKKEDGTEFTSGNMIEKYYEANGLNYKRRNDLSLLKRIEQEKQVINNTQDLIIQKAIVKQNGYLTKYIEKERKKIELINKSVEKKVSFGVMQRFEEQYIDLDKFTFTIYDYIENIHTIITKMREIPIDKG